MRKRKKGTAGRYLPAVALFAALLVLWQVLAACINIPHIFPGPVAVVKRTWELRGTLFLKQLPPTLVTILAGWGISIALAIVLAILMLVSRHVEAMLRPLIVISQTIPVMCISPLFVLWFGYTIQARLTAVVLSCFFALTQNIYDGFRRTDEQKIEMMRSMGASRLQIFFYLEVPSAYPMFMTGLKMTFPWAVIDAAVAEWLGATEGLGYFSRRMIIRMDGPAVFAAVLVLTLLALAGMAAIHAVDRKTAGYRSQL